jgi:hypothetical protein
MLLPFCVLDREMASHRFAGARANKESRRQRPIKARRATKGPIREVVGPRE